MSCFLNPLSSRSAALSPEASHMITHMHTLLSLFLSLSVILSLCRSLQYNYYNIIRLIVMSYTMRHH